MTGFDKKLGETSYDRRVKEWTSREIQLARLHEEILSRREVLLSCSATYHKSQELRNSVHAWGLDQAYQRNEVLLQDFRGIQGRVYDELSKPPSPRFTTLEKNYWAMVKSQVPMWEQDIGIKRQKVQPQSSPSTKQPLKGQQQQKAGKKQSKKKRSFFS